MALKWILGALGWVVGGYIGGILGFAIGAMVDGSSKQLPPGGGDTYGRYTGGTSGGYAGGYTQTEQRNSFLISLLVLSTAVMKADGKVLRSELNFIKDFIANNFGVGSVQPSLNIIKQLLKKNVDIYQACVQIKGHMAYSQRLQLFHYLLGIAQIDGRVAPEESALLFQIGGYLGLDQKDVRSIMGMFEADKDPYKILEIDKTATDEQVRKAYRRLAAKYHPDKVENLGADVRKSAEEKFKAMQSAYEQIKKERGMK